MGILTIWSLSRVINNFLNTYRFVQKRAEVLNERLQKSISTAIEERFADGVLLSQLNGKDIKFRYYPFDNEDEDKFYCLGTDKRGIVSDINISKLKEFADLVEKEANISGYSFKESEFDIKSGIEKEYSDETRKIKYKANSSRYLKKKFHDPINEKHNILLCIDKKLIKDKSVMPKLYKLAEGFLEYMKQYKGIYSYENALKERRSLFGGWQEIKWLSSDISDVFKRALKSNDNDIIRLIGFLPIAIANRGIAYKDHYLFQEFINYGFWLYSFSFEQDNDIRGVMIDCSWRYLKELSLFYIESKLKEKSLDEHDLIDYKNFAIYILKIFQKLLKEAFDTKCFTFRPPGINSNFSQYQ